METRGLMIAGVRTPCLDTGGHAADAAVFIHGNPGAGSDWLDLLAQVGAFGRAVAPDMPGFAKADKPAGFDYTVRGYATHLHALLAALGIERAHLVLHDFGGPWGLAWAAAHPERVASVTLINSGILPGITSPASGARRCSENCSNAQRPALAFTRC
jgi:pimeloyl-ACP methyl ester carboxylesterase